METSSGSCGKPDCVGATAIGWWAIVAALVATSVSAVDCPADAGLHGTVRSLSGKPVADAAVTLTTSARTVATGEDGRFCLFQVEPGVHRLVVFADGYGVAEQELLVGDQGATQVDVRLRAAFGEEVVISATRTGKRLADVPLHVQTVRRSQIEGVVARTLADAVEWTRGVRVESNCQSCNTSQIRLLGLEGPYSQVLVDGQPTVSSLAMVYGIEQLPARLIDSIEVVRGGGSPAYGAGAVAGVINLIPHHPDHTHVEVSARSSRMGGAGGAARSPSYSMVADLMPGSSRAATFYGQADREAPVDVDGDGFTDVSIRDLDALGARYQEFLFDGAARFAVDASHMSEFRRGGDQLHLPPQQAQVAEQLGSHRKGVTASWLQTASARWDWRATVSHAGVERDSYYGASGDSSAFGTTLNPLWLFDTQVNRGGERGTLSFGLQASDDFIHDRQPAYGRIIRERYRGAAAFIQDDRKVADGVTLLYGLRVDRHSAVDGSIVSPRAALMWTPRSDLTLRVSHSAGFRPPAVFDEQLHIALLGGEAMVVRDDPGLREETSVSRMLSVEWRPMVGERTAMAFDSTFFDTTIADLFHNREADDPATPELEFLRTNFGHARVAGVEAGWSLRRGRLAVDLGYGWQRAEFGHPEPDFGSTRMFRTPERYGTASVRWPLSGGLDLFAGLRYTGQMAAPHYAGYIAEDRLELTPSFLAIDVGVSRRFVLGGDRGIVGTFAVKNLTDEYQQDLDRGPLRDAGYVYGPRFPRSVVVGVKVDL
ncbi:MAG: TonB-dependent receptor [Holophagales bacterium]|nr:TonB-dependent receptor [Holophagales bacterium]MYF97332.1 TonB-dependent receptor [Holophagales bacterium]